MVWLRTRTCGNFVNKMHSIVSSISKMQSLYFWEIWKTSSSNSASYIMDKWIISQFCLTPKFQYTGLCFWCFLWHIILWRSCLEWIFSAVHSIFQRKVSRGKPVRAINEGMGGGIFGQIYLTAFPSSHWKLKNILVCPMICNALQKVNHLCLLS